MPFHIRPVDQSEKAQWSALFQGYADFYSVSLTPAAQSQTWSWIHDEDEDFWSDVAISDDGEWVGLVQYQLMHRSLSAEKVCYLSDLYVIPSIRGTGSGRALIDHVFSVAKGKNWSNVRWLTQEGNARARKLYDHYAPRSEFILYSIPVKS